MLDFLKRALFYASLTKEQWILVRNMIRKENRFFLTMTSAVMASIMGILAVYTKFFDNVYPENAGVYAAIAAVEFILFVLAKVVAESNMKVIPVLTMLFNLFMYSFGIAIGSVFDTENYALAFIIMVIVLPLVFCVAPICSAILVLFVDVVFLVISYHVKDPSVFEVDVMNVVVWTVVGVFLNCILTSSRARNHMMLLKQIDSQFKVQESLDTVKSQMAVFRSLGNVYTALYYVDLKKDSYEELVSIPETRAFFGESGKNASVLLHVFCEKIVVPNHEKDMLAFTNLSAVAARLKTQNMVSATFLSKVVIDKANVHEWTEMSFIAVNRDENLNVTSVLVAARSIHEEKNREQEQMNRLQQALVAAESANKSKTVFLNSMSHDIRTPMNAITGFTNLAQKHVENKELVVDYLGKIAVANAHLLSLINDVLDMSRIESGRVHLNEKPESVSTIVSELKTIVHDDVRSRSLTLNVEQQGFSDRFVLCDKMRLKQILLNILSNAIKFSKEGGRIDFAVKELDFSESGRVTYEFVVRDTGIGMSEEFISRIFQPFERETTSTVSGIQGSGLGMSITKNLVDMMGGNISVKSCPNEGSEFVVQVCFKEAVPAEKSTESPAEKTKVCEGLVKTNQFAGKRILLVEDNEMNRMIVLHLLRETHVEIDVAENGKIACQKVEENVPGYYDVVLMDIQMPVMDGYTATRNIRDMENPLRANIPIVAMTADAFEAEREKALSVGMNGHIAKPVDFNLLLGVLQGIFGLKA
ncbi:MAG: response regulator [Fibrobacter sp.]|nr:response regulator [Fibrobacter sp.]